MSGDVACFTGVRVLQLRRMATTTHVVLLRDLIEDWLSRNPALAPSTVHRDRWAKSVIVDHFGEDRDAGSITREEVLEFRKLLEETFTTTTPRIIMRLLVRPLERAHVEGRIPRCVVAGMLLSTTNGRFAE